MTEEIKLNYQMADEMVATFKKGAEQLETTSKEMQSIAATLEDGALLGRAGTTFTDAVRNKLCPAINNLTAKFNELAKDVTKAKQFMQEADKQSRSKFK